jgi:hypothetical protein
VSEDTPARDHWVELVEQATRFVDACKYLAETSDEVIRRGLQGVDPLPAILCLFLKDPAARLPFVPEVLTLLTEGRSQYIVAARELLRGMPRRDVENRLGRAMTPVLSAGGYEAYFRIFEVLVELRLERLVRTLLDMAHQHHDPDVRELPELYPEIVDDTERWGFLVQEWPTVQGETGD